MSGSSQQPTSFRLLDIAKEVTRFFLREINVLPEYLKGHWDVVFAFTTSAAAASAVFKYLTHHRGNPGKIEIAVFHIIRLFEARADRKELLAEPQKLISEMDDEVTTMIDRDLITQYEAESVARMLKRDVDSGVLRLTNTSSRSWGSILDDSPTLFLTTSPARPSFALRGGYGLDYDDPELYPSSESASPASSPARPYDSSWTASRSPPLSRHSLRSPRPELTVALRNEVSSLINMEISKIQMDSNSPTPQQRTEMTKVGADQPGFPSQPGKRKSRKWPYEPISYVEDDKGSTEIVELDDTSTKVSSISVVSTLVPSTERSPISSSPANPQSSPPIPPGNTDLPAPHTATKNCMGALSPHTLLAVIPPPYEPTTKPPPESPKFSRSQGAKTSKPRTRARAGPEPGVPKTAPNTDKPKSGLRASTRITRYQGPYTK
jgi:hypothetical protein